MRVAVLCDYAEEQWPSMDACATLLLDHLNSGDPSGVSAARIQPRLCRRFTRVSSAPWSVNADRLLNRHIDYGRAIRSLRNFDLFHIADHSYAQLVHSLPAERTLVTCHDTDTFRCILDPAAEPRPLWFRAMAKRTLAGLQQAAAVICVSQATRTQLLTRGLLAPEKITVIPNGIDPAFLPEPCPKWDAEADRLLGPAPNSRDILHVGSTIARKRIDLLLRIFAATRRQHPAARLIRVGGPFTPEQSLLAAQLGLDGSILQLPFLPAGLLAALYRRVQLALVPSEAEGFGLPVAEAMACGTPVIASDIPALRETGGHAPEFCAVGDVGRWADAVSCLLADRVRRRAMAQVGLRRAPHYSWAANTREVAALYRTILFQTRKIRAQEKDHHHWRRRLHRL